ncbi:MAG: glycosyltransferase family 4 protein [Patescibacteria group bacterium]
MTMKVAMIGQKGIPAVYGGIERHAEELALELVKKGHRVTVYAREWYTPKNLQTYKGVEIIHTPTIRTKHLDAIAHSFFSTIHAMIKKNDIIHFHGVGPSLLSWIPRIFAPKIKVIATVHCLDRYHQKWGWFARTMLRFGEWAACKFPRETISVSKTIYNYCLNEFQKQTNYIPNGVRRAEKAGSVLIEDKWELEAQKYILMISRLIKHKGAHYLISAWQRARQQNPEIIKDCKLVIVGGANFTDEYVNNLREMARGDKSILFTGWQSGRVLDELYANAKLFVHPSENEGLPITVLQAMSHGKPVLVSDIPEHKEIISDSRFWFSNAKVKSLTEKLVELMSDERLLESAGSKNKINVEKNYSWEDIADQTLSVYEDTENMAIKYQPIEA